MPVMKCSQFMRRLPDAVRQHLPEELRAFRCDGRNWLSQIWYEDRNLHYEVWKLTDGERLEVGLHFESRDRDLNKRYLRRMERAGWEIQAELGESILIDPWDKGWSKVYQTVPLQPLTDEYLDEVACRLAQIIQVLEPLRRQASA